MDSAEREAKQVELSELRQRVAQLEQELEGQPVHWEATKFYTGYYALAGFVLGMFGAVTSLLFNVVGSALVGSHPLRLIQIYLTFPLGERALELNGGLTLTIGCCLYIGTGMLLGIPFHLLLMWITDKASFGFRVGVATVLAGGMWLVHFYLILSWLQPILFGGNWIVEMIPWWIGLVTHLIYGWTMALVFPLGLYVPYRRQTEYA
ncbi:MAG: hypothetical protein H6823_19555 [Planctomycetaceae bacterium]|nr:hypothetical protein [Planctomycetales bacterium]MCA9170576.1 hypothetical protein [Planctomycetales bacterium]MCB9940443.1 hypothetical protein [Planctomycetaceae bacterium]